MPSGCHHYYKANCRFLFGQVPKCWQWSLTCRPFLYSCGLHVQDCIFSGTRRVPDCISGLCFCNQTLLHLLLVCVCSNAAFGLSFYKWKVISNSVCHKWSGVELHFPLKCSRMQIYQVQFVKLINVTFHYCKLCSHIFGSIKETSEHHLWIYCFSHLL